MIGQRLIDQARQPRQRNLLRFVGDDGRVQGELTAAELVARASSIAAHLREEHGLRPGDRVVLVHTPSLDFVEAYAACLLSGLVAVPVMPPDPGGDVAGFRRLCEDSGARAILTHGPYLRARQLSRVRGWLALRGGPSWPELPWIATDRARGARAFTPHVPAPSDLVFLQYTSGTTGTPKGVRVTHENLAHQLEFNRRSLGFKAEGRGVIWVPQYHDFGLIASISSGLWGNGSVTIMSPFTFMRRPDLWFEVLHRERGTYTCTPNFGLELAVRKTTPEQRRRWDLSCVEVIVNAAEPVRAETEDRFLEAFGPCGLRREALQAAYGLAEHVVGVTLCGSRRRVEADVEALDAEGRLAPPRRPGAGRWLVSCGRPGEDIVVRCVDPATRRPVEPGRVGEVWVDSPSRADGYERRPEESAAVFEARLDPPDGRAYLRTGDLGVIDEGELFITGRLKDLIIVRGRNVHPTDVEEVVREAHPAIRPGGLASFAVPTADGSEGLVVWIEVTDEAPASTAPAIAAAARAALARSALGVFAVAVVVGRRGLVLKTTSGKVRRGACRAQFLAPDFGRPSRDSKVILVDRAEAPAAAPGDPTTETTSAAGTAEPATTATPTRTASAPADATPPVASGRTLERLTPVAAGVLGRPLRAGDVDVPLRDLGMDSLQLVDLCQRLEQGPGLRVTPEQLFEAPTLRALAALLDGALDGGPAGAARPTGPGPALAEPVAIVGLACRFPGGLDDEATLWAALREGRGPRAARFGDAVERFDPAPFGLSAREATRLAPEQRLALELAWEAFESAGLAPDRLDGLRCGVFLGASQPEYTLRSIYGGRPDAWAAMGSMPSVVAGRISYTFGLRGPALVVDTACSSSLVAVHLAAQSLQRGECDLALAGGVNVALEPALDEAMRSSGALSPTGRCWSFDARADGYQRADGAALVVLRRASDAERRGDRVLAEVRASAVNQDGRSNGLSAPNLAQQRAVIAEAWAAVDAPEGCGFVEAHGSGTPLGDGVELQGLAETLAAAGQGAGPVWVGSAKGNVGHVEAAAGVAGLIRAALALHHGEVPPQADHATPTPRFDWSRSRLRVAARAATPWTGPRFAGVSSFGLSGTNAHVVLAGAGEGRPAQRPPARVEGDAARPAVLVIGAHAEAAARERAAAVAARLREGAPLHDVAASLATTAPDHAWRVAVVAGDAAAAADGLERAAPRQRPATPRVAFTFPGQGTLRAGAVARLREAHPRLRELLDEALEAMARVTEPGAVEAVLRGADAECQRTDRAQPALVAVGWALLRLWVEWGVTPRAVAGHSAGELAAAAAAGSLSIGDALRLAAERGRAMREAPPGAMLAARATLEHVASLLPADVRVAVHNGPRDLVLAGPGAAIERLAVALEAQGAAARPVAVPHAFHTPSMADAARRIAAAAAALPAAAPRLAWISSVDGRRLEAAPPPGHWGAQIEAPVRWDLAAEALGAEAEVLLELGASDDLTLLGRRLAPDRTWVASGRGVETTPATLLEAAADLFRAGVRLDWRAVLAPWPLRRVPVPGVAWQRQRLWLDRRPATPGAGAGGAGQRLDVAGVGAAFDLTLGEPEAWLRDHRVGGAPLVPAALWLEWLSAVGRAWSGAPAARVVDLVVERPTTWQPDLRLQALVRPDGAVEVHAADERGAWGARRARARLEASSEPPPPPPGIEDARPCDVTAAYADLARRELEYGPTFRRVTAARVAPRGGWAALDPLAPPAGLHQHPAVLDAALHPLAFALARHGAGVWLPAGASSYLSLRPLAGAPEAVTVVTRRQADELRADVWLVDPLGVAAVVRGLALRSLARGRTRVLATRWEPVEPRGPAAAGVAGLVGPGVADVVGASAPGAADVVGASAPGAASVVGASALGAADVVGVVGASAPGAASVVGASAPRAASAVGASVVGASAPGVAGLVGPGVADVVGASAPGVASVAGLVGPGVAGVAGASALGVASVVGASAPGVAGVAGASAPGAASAVGASAPGAASVVGASAPGAASVVGVVGPGAAAIVAALRAAGRDARALPPDLSGADGAGTVVVALEPGAPELASVELCRAVGRAASALRPAPRVVVATRQGVAVEAGEPLDAAAAAAWAFTRVLRRELPEHGWALRDLGGGELDGALARALDAPDEELAARGGRLLAPARPAQEQLQSPAPSVAAARSDRGLLDEVTLREEPAPRPGRGQVALEVRAAGLNLRDVLAALGVVPGAPRGRLGGECAGVVVAVGEGVLGLRPGDRVVAFAAGSIATHVVADAREVAPLPPGLSFTDGGAAPIVFATAWHALVERAGLKAGERVLIHAVTGGVGMAALQVARRIGAEVFATAHPSKWAEVRALGVEHVASSRDTSFAPAFRAVAGERGLDVVLDAAVGEVVDAGLSLLRPGGRFVEIGKRDVRDPDDVRASHGVEYVAFDLASLGVEARGALLRRVLDLLAAGELRPLPREVFPLADVRLALRHMAEARHRGKVVLRPPPAPGGAALITGGLGALGQRTAAWLARRHGVDAVVLLGRSASEEALGPELRELRAGGLRVEVARGDASAPSDLAAAVERAGPTLRWVVHAAGVLDDAPALRQSVARVQAVLQPKLAAARALDALTRGRELAAFVVYGSAAAWFGPPGQSAYAAANAAMESVVHARRARGEVGTYVAFGPWQGPGMAASEEARRALARMGVGLLDPQDALDRLDEVLWSDLSPAAIVAAERGAAAPRAEAARRDASLPLAERVRAAVARVLSLPPDGVPTDVPLSKLGLDSLAGIELRNELVQATGRDLSLALVGSDPTLERLVEALG